MKYTANMGFVWQFLVRFLRFFYFDVDKLQKVEIIRNFTVF